MNDLTQKQEIAIYKKSVKGMKHGCKIGPYCIEVIVQHEGSIYIVRHFTTMQDIIDDTCSHQIIQVGSLGAYATDIHGGPIDMSVYGVPDETK